MWRPPTWVCAGTYYVLNVLIRIFLGQTNYHPEATLQMILHRARVYPLAAGVWVLYPSLSRVEVRHQDDAKWE